MSYRNHIARLADVCGIQTGYTARGALNPVLSGGVPAIQLRDLRQGDFDSARLPKYELDGSIDRYWATPGDVLFRSRGEMNTAVAVSKTSDAAIAVLPLLILRPNRDEIEPEYLAWFINQPPAQRYFDNCARGTGIRMIPRPCLEDLEIELPDLGTQRHVVEIDRLARRETELLTLLAEKRRTFAGATLLAQIRRRHPQVHDESRLSAVDRM